jgi:hypothetical protein
MSRRFIPDAVHTSDSAAFKLNIWTAVAIFLAALGRWLLQETDLAPEIRAGVLLVPLIPSGFYVLAIFRWIRGLDELQRRIQHEAWFFSTVGTILVLTALNLLSPSGALANSRLAHGLGWEGRYALSLLLWVIGCFVATRRYQ